jgi:uncharacterized protein (TIGR03435 family)
MSIRNLLLIATVAIASAQTQPAFEAASVKPVDPGDRVGSYSSYNEYMGSLQALIRFAYRIEDYRMSGGPKWIDADKFDVIYKPSGPQASLMLRGLLAERFKLAVHTETRQLPVYSMAIAKSGPKMEKATDANRAGSWGSAMVLGTMEMPELASHLASILGRQVTDQTGLAGAYTFSLKWTPDDKPVTDNSPPSLVTAIQEQLGLRLDSTKGPVEILVVDHAEKPTEN